MMKVELTGAEVAEAIGEYARRRHPRADCNEEFACSVAGPMPFMMLLGSSTPVVIVELAPKPERGEG